MHSVFDFLSMSAETKDYMKNFGSLAILNLGFRDSWVMIGQRGLEKGRAIEQVRMATLCVFKSRLF